MKLYVNEKLFSFHNRYYIKDEHDVDVYEIASKFISLGDKTTITDMYGNQVAYIEQELFHLAPHYNVYINGYEFKIIKKIQLFKNDYELSNGYRVEGSFMMYDFNVLDEKGEIVGNISREFFTLGDKYQIEIFDESKKDIILAIIVAITNDIDRSQAASSS